MRVEVHPDAARGTLAAADALASWLTAPGARSVVVAAGNTPLPLYREIGSRRLPLSHLAVFALDEYVGVPPEDPRTCANLLARTVRDAWGIPPGQFHALSPIDSEAPRSLLAHERKLAAAGRIDAAVLGLGRNGHLGFNEPGSGRDSPGRVLDLEPTSIEANRQWFAGDHAPSRGVTLGLGTLLSARRILLLAFGREKAPAVAGMIERPQGKDCPASWLRDHPEALAVLDRAAASLLSRRES